MTRIFWVIREDFEMRSTLIRMSPPNGEDNDRNWGEEEPKLSRNQRIKESDWEVKR